jgi:superfamily II DNA or RNA helicase
MSLSLFARKPLVIASSAAAMLRDYQAKAAQSVVESLKSLRSVLLVMATGCGKTQVAIAIGERHLNETPLGQVLVLAGRRGLVEQFAERIKLVTGEIAEIEMGERRSVDARWIVASKDSLYDSRLDKRDHIKPTLIVVDEAHHAVAESYQKIVARFPDAKVVGLTATPDRTDELALGQVFEDVPFVYEILDAINDGWLVPVMSHRAILEGLDLSAVKTTAGDLNAKQLDDLMSEEGHVHELVQLSMQHSAGRKRGLVFTTSIVNADHTRDVFNHYAPGSAVSIDSSKSPEDNARAIAAHKAGDAKWLVNVGMYTEGMDDPLIDFIVMGRPTKSRALYAQCSGRGTRTAPGIFTPSMGPAERRRAIAASSKPNLFILDLTGQAGRHSLMGPEDILGGKYPEDVIEEAKRRQTKEPYGAPVLQSLEEAAKELAKRDAEKLRIANARKLLQKYGVMVKGKLEAIDPFATMGAVNPEDSWGNPERFGFKRPSPRMVEVLEKRGITVGPKLSYREAKALLVEIFRRQDEGLASFKQMKVLKGKGLHCDNWSFEKASKAITELVENGWRISPSRIQELNTENP